MVRLQSIIQRVKRTILPHGKSFRQIKFGPAAGRIMKLDLQHELRIFFGFYERELIPHYRALLKPGMRSFDIGGRDGYTALLIASITGSEVISFECDGSSMLEMQETFQRNPLPIKAVQAFVGKSTGACKITIDDAAEQYFSPNLIKVDVEGAEVEVLRGATDILRTQRPCWIVEVHGQPEELECIRILRSHDYDITIVDQSRYMREQRPISHNRWIVCRP